MVIDVHCHVGFSARRADPSTPRFACEPHGAQGHPGFDSYFSPRLLHRWDWFFVRRWLGLRGALAPGEELDRLVEALFARHWDNLAGVDRLVLLAFDEYRDDAGQCLGPAQVGQRRGTDLYVSNSLVRAIVEARPDRFLFGASIHPYRPDALTLLKEVVSAGAVLVKWLPIHQNIRADDARTIAFLHRAAELRIAMLIHYGGEMTLSRQHMEFENPAPLLTVLRSMRHEGSMPAVIVAHAATPSFIWQSGAGHRALVNAMMHDLADAPLYADISALAAFGRTRWLVRLARRRELHRKLVWGSDFPVPVILPAYWRQLPRATRRRIAAMPSWISQDLALKRALGFDDGVFTRAAEILAVH